jgi:hemerythrin-like metal-binding protein
MNIPEIDRAHHRLVDLMAQLEKESLAGASRTVLNTTFRTLGEATQKHFTEEEALMQRIGYTELAQHKIIHASLLERFQGHLTAFQNGKGGVDPEVFNFLSFWLRSHICGVDQRYADQARAHPQGGR